MAKILLVVAALVAVAFGYQKLHGGQSPHDQAVSFLKHDAALLQSYGGQPSDVPDPASVRCSNTAITPDFPNSQVEQQIGSGTRLVTCTEVTQTGFVKTLCIGVGSKLQSDAQRPWRWLGGAPLRASPAA